ncbi:MAG TPA: MBL fold metallo-hydrolase RNA specificity domain-containing protein, partial [Opitutaceae bacterium]
MPWDVKFRAGVYLPEIDWWLDAHFPVHRSFVSHAHSDHTALHKEVICSLGTSRLMQARIPGERREHVLNFHQRLSLGDETSISLYPAGHIFGSAQSLLEHPERGSLLYTGDFKLRRGLSAEACETPHADTVIMETTYARSHYVFPPTAEVLDAIARFCHETIEHGDVPVLFGYSLGKSQELLSSLAAAQLPIMLHPQTVKMTRVYESLGIQFPAHREFSAEEVAGHVVICPPQSNQSTFLKKIPRRRTAVITGWALDPGAIFRYQCDAAFPLSDHADFPDLIRFVELVKPQRVLTLHGFAVDFARTLRERGVEAWAIGQDNQLEFAIPTATTVPIVHEPSPETAATVAEDEAAQPADSLDRFASTAERIRATPKKLEKIAWLNEYFRTLSDEAAAIAAVFFTGRPFAQSDERELNLGWAVIRRAVLDATGLTEADFRQTYLRYSDSGETAEALLTGRTQPEACSLRDTLALLAELAGKRGPALKLESLRDRI